MSDRHQLTARQRRELEAELLGERARLERSQVTDQSPDDSVDTAASVATATQSALGVMVRGRTRARYDAINDALDRLATGRYGTCAGCGAPIPYGRLIVMPEVPHCVACSPVNRRSP